MELIKQYKLQEKES